MSALSYMQRRPSGIYEFRRRLPSSLAGKPAPKHVQAAFPDLINPKTGSFKREIVRSLGVADQAKAKRADHLEALRVQDLFEAAERALTQEAPTGMSESDIQNVAEEVYAQILAADEEEREEGDDRRHLQTPGDRSRWPDLIPVDRNVKGMVPDHFAVFEEFTSELGADYRKALARRDPKIVEAETRQALRKRGLTVVPNSPEFRRLSLATLHAHVKAYDAIAARNRGDIVITPSAVSSADWGHARLSDAFDAWKAGGVAAGTRKPSPQTLLEAEQAVKRFTELHGDLFLAEIDRVKAREFRDAMARLPKGLPQRLRKLPIKVLLARDLSGFEPRDGATINKLLALLGAILSKAVTDGRMDHVPEWSSPFGKHLRLKPDERKASRQLFTRAELRRFFSSSIFTEGERPEGGGGEASFWFPLISLLSGMRLGEIAGLRISDLLVDEEETGRWFFQVSARDGRSVKTASSVRSIPVHPELERIGLLHYRAALLKGGASTEDDLWPEVRSAKGRERSASWSQWFGRYLRREGGIPDRSKTFHSLRHNFKRMARDADISEEQHDALTGHAGGGIGRRYGRDKTGSFSLRPLVDAMEKIGPPIDLSGIEWRSG